MSGVVERVELSSEEWASLLDLAELGSGSQMEAGEIADLLGESDELTRVSRRISGQYAEILAGFASQAFRGRARKESGEQALAALDALQRLATAAGDREQAALLEELSEIVPGASDSRKNSRARYIAIAALRDWIPRFADTLAPEDGRRLVKLVQWDGGSAPLMEELASLRGIGPKRLGRLYAAGLHTVDVVASADPVDVASVTGLPSRLSVDVVDATRQFALDERRRCLEQLRDRALRLREILRAVPASDEEIRRLAEEAVHEVELTFSQLSSKEDAP